MRLPIHTVADMSTATLEDTSITSITEQAAVHRHELQEQGWTVFRNIMTPAQCTAGRVAIDRLIEAGMGIHAGDQHFHTTNLVAKDAVFRELAIQPLLLATVEGLIGADCILSSCNMGARRPGGDRQALHRDTSIWGPSLPYLDIPIGIQTAWCFDDFTLENGATHVISGSHARADAREDEPNIQLTAPAGSMVAFDARLFHAGGANRTQHIRRAALTLYIRSWLKPQTDHKRSFPRELITTVSPKLLRLLGFQRQTPVENPNGQEDIVMAPGATFFYGQPPTATTVTY